MERSNATQRPYAVVELDREGKIAAERVVIAQNQYAAIRHVTAGRFSAHPLGALELHALIERGLKVERAGAESDAQQAAIRG